MQRCNLRAAWLLRAVFAALLGNYSFAAGLELFTAAEAAAWNRAGPKGDFGNRDLNIDVGMPNCHQLPQPSGSAPKIDILAPTLDQPLSAPLDIELKFVPGSGAAIRPETFRVCYLGFVTIDITKRITDHITVSAQGIHVAGAQLPHGHHHLVLLIADQQGHQGRSEATFDIR